MAKRLQITSFLFAFFMTGESITMEQEDTGSQMRGLKPLELEYVQKMLLLEERMNNLEVKDKDAHIHICKALHAISLLNPVLNATMEFTHPRSKVTVSFQIGTKVIDGMIDLSDKIFGEAVNYMVLTADPSVFLYPHGDKLVILIAPWSLIHDNLKSSTTLFEPIMKTWDQTKAPIGIFWRVGSESASTDNIAYLISKDVSKLSINFYEHGTVWGTSNNFKLKTRLRLVGDYPLRTGICGGSKFHFDLK